MSDRRRLTASGRVALAVVGVLAAGVMLVTVIAYVGTTRLISADVDAALLREAEAYVAAIAPRSTEDTQSLPDASRAYLEGRAGTAGGIQPIHVVRFADGAVLSNSQVRLEDAEQNAVLLDPERAERGFASITYEGTEYRALTAPVTGQDGVVLAVFQVAIPTDQATEVANELAIALLLAGGVVVIAGAAISLRVARASLSPLRDMADAASRVTQASLDERIGYDGPPDELGELADALNSMLDRLEEAFTAQRAFVADASHELRTPIAVIRGNLDLMEHPATTESEKAECLRIIDEEVRRMTRLLEDMLSLTRMRAGARRPFQPVETATLVSEVAFRMRSLGERDVSCDCDPAAWVLGDPDLLEQALLNVVRNAIEHTAEDGHIWMRCRVAGDRVLLVVTDDGPGIPEADLERVFDRFYRSGERRAESEGGSGLGLAITRGLVGLHDGTITATNRSEGGAEFTLSLPRTDAPSDAGDAT